MSGWFRNQCLGVRGESKDWRRGGGGGGGGGREGGGGGGGGIKNFQEAGSWVPDILKIGEKKRSKENLGQKQKLKVSI